MSEGAPDAGGALRLLPGAVTWRVIDDEAIVLDIGRSEYIGLNRSATVIFVALGEGTTRTDAIATLQERFSISEELATADVDAFLGDCRDKGWLA